jgi:predicted nucleic acid-binding Zn ribbon protein
MADKSKPEFLPIGEAIRGLLNTFHLDSKFDEAAVVASWDELVGQAIAKRTRKVRIRNKVLYVEFTSAAVKNDFLLHKPKVIELFQSRFGKQVVTDLVIL